MRSSSRARVLAAVGAVLVAAVVGACTGAPSPPPEPVTADPRPEPSQGQVDLDDLCGTVDGEVVARLLPAAELDRGHTTGEGYTSARCDWENGADQQPHGMLEVTVDSTALPEGGVDPRDMVSGTCLGGAASPEGPGELFCSDGGPGPDGGGVVSMTAVQGPVVVDLVLTKLAGGEVSDDERAALEQVTTVLLTAMPTP